MSKLFDQLKDAAREREGGLLMGALAKKHAEEAAAAAAAAPAGAESPPASPAPAVTPAPARAEAAPAHSAPASPSGSPLVGMALAAAIFGIAVLAWHSAPWRAPQKLKIDPEELKLDRKLDLDRAPPKGTTEPSRPS